MKCPNPCHACEDAMSDNAMDSCLCDDCLDLISPVSRFGTAMIHKLHRNHAKGDRDGWMKLSEKELLELLTKEVSELADAIECEPLASVRLEAVDVGNFAMMIFDVCTARMNARKDGHK